MAASSAVKEFNFSYAARRTGKSIAKSPRKTQMSQQPPNASIGRGPRAIVIVCGQGSAAPQPS